MRTHAGTHKPTHTHTHTITHSYTVSAISRSVTHTSSTQSTRKLAYQGGLSFCSNASSRRDSLLCLTLFQFLDALTKLSAKARTLQGLGWQRLRLQSLVPISCSPERNHVRSTAIAPSGLSRQERQDLRRSPLPGQGLVLPQVGQE